MNQLSIVNRKFSIELREQLLAGPDYFTCERNRTRMRKIACLERQEKGIPVGMRRKREIPSECMDCPQGKEIKELARPAVRDEAGGELKEMDTEKKTCTRPGCDDPVKAKGLCERHYNMEYNRQLWEKKRGLREKIEIEPSKSTTHTADKPAAEKTLAPKEEIVLGEEGHSIIMVDFAEFPELLDQLEKRARIDFGPIEHQVLYLVKRGLEEGL